jgi:hypothetical protein
MKSEQYFRELDREFERKQANIDEAREWRRRAEEIARQTPPIGYFDGNNQEITTDWTRADHDRFIRTGRFRDV